MKAIDNSGLINFCHSCNVSGFVPAITFSMANSTKILTVTDATTYPAGDGANVVNLIVSDKFGNVKTAQITATSTTIDLSTGFNLTEGYTIQAMVASDNRLTADLTAYDVYRYSTASTGTTTGSLGYVDTNN